MIECSKCCRILTSTNFHKHSSSKNGLRGECKECRKEYDLKRYEENKDAILENRKKYYDKTKNIPEVISRKRNTGSKYYLKNYEKFVLNRCKQRARKRGLECNIDIEDINIPEVCPVLGIPLARSQSNPSASSPSVDRIDPEQGYVKGNIQIISQLANTMKSNATPEQLVNFAKWVLLTYENVI